MTTFLKISIFIVFAFLVPLKIFSQKLPEGYIEQYSEKCLNNTFFNSFLPEEMSDWKFIQAAKGNILSISSEDSIPIKLFP